MNKKIKILICVIFVTSIIFFSYILFKKNDSIENGSENSTYISEVINDECTEEYEKSIETTTVSSSEEKVSANAILILKKYYQKCDHTINEYVELPQELVNMTKEEVQSEYPDWEVIGFEEGKVTLYKEFNDVCGEHFVLKVKDGHVIVYTVNEDGTEDFYEETGISSEYLTETDLITMQNGLEIYGKEELNQTIEDFE